MRDGLRGCPVPVWARPVVRAWAGVRIAPAARVAAAVLAAVGAALVASTALATPQAPSASTPAPTPSPAAAAPTTLHLRIDLREEIAAGRFDPARDALGVRGGLAPLSWQRSVRAAPGAEPGVYVLELRFERAPFGGQPLAYKFKIERDATPQAGWEEGANRLVQLTPGEVRVERRFGSATPPLPPRRTWRIERIAPRPSAFVTAREVQVWLPPGYDAAPERRYPVLYLHDGQNVFDWGAAGAEWMVDETAERLVAEGAVEPFIVVAVASGAERIADYTPWVGGLAGGGGAARYARHLVHELKPMIDARYRTRRERAHTAVGGSSLGGLVSMWLLLEHGETFGAALVVSPSVWWAGERIVAAVRSQRARLLHARVWLDIGLPEGERAVAGARRLRDALRAAGVELAYTEDRAGSHDEAAWAARVEGMLRFLYPRRGAR